MLGKKKESENLEKVMQEEFRADREKLGRDGQVKSKEKTREGEMSHLKKPRLDDLDPNLRVMGYIYNKQKHSLNRNSILRSSANLVSFENLFSLCKKFFTKNNFKDKSHTETMSFIEELLSGEDLNANKAIIVVPSIYYPGNLSYENARQFLVDAS
jgi:hypothetical protein